MSVAWHHCCLLEDEEKGIDPVFTNKVKKC